jgi:phospholipase/lecithinase/hemolysin
LQDVPGPGALVIPSLQSQLGLYLTSTGGVADPNALYILWGGANDLYSAVETPGETPAQIAATETAMAGTLAGEISVLSSAGAKNFLWLNLPQLASTPRAVLDGLSPAVNGALAAASTQFRTDVAADSAALESLLGVKIADVDVYGLYLAIMANPAAFGYVNVTTPAQGLSGINPDQYLFWDVPSHPTTTGHALIGELAATDVLQTFGPEPSTWVIIGTGLFAFAWLGRKSRARHQSVE